jgi:ribosomal protein L29
MAKENKKLSEKEVASKLKDLKIELLKNPTKKKSIKKEIARILTMNNNQTKLGENK